MPSLKKWISTAEFLARCWLESHRHAPRLRHIEAFIDEYVATPTINLKPIVIFNASTRIWGLSLNSAFSLLTAWGLRLAGFPVHHFVCMAGMEQCVLGTIRSRLTASPPCKSCMRLSRQMYPKALRYSLERGGENSEFVKEERSLDALRQVVFKEYELGKMCFPSLQWVLRRHNVPDTPEVRGIFRKYLNSAINILTGFQALVDEIHPHTVIVFNGIMFPEAVVREVALRNGIPVITHEVGVQPYSAFFTTGHATAYPIEIEDDFNLTPLEEVLLDTHISTRFQGDFTMAGIRFWPEMRGLDKALLERMQQFKQVVAVFTNVIFDTSQVHANVIFTDMFHWLEEVVSFARQHQDTLFVIRAHPDELRPGKESQETVEFVLERSGALGLPNLYFVPPKEFISSYDLILKSKLVLVYNSSIGLEATLLNRVAICGGASRYTRYPTVYFPSSSGEYFEMIERYLAEDKPRPPEEFIQQARRFTYYQHFLSSLDFSPFLEPHQWFPGYVNLSDFNPLDLHPDRNLNIRILKRGILHGGSMFYDRGDVQELQSEMRTRKTSGILTPKDESR